MVAGLRNVLASSGVDVVDTTARGALVLSSDQGHLVDGEFDVQRMPALLDDLLEHHPALCGICQPHRDMLPADAVQVARYTHRTIHINRMVPLLNPYYRQNGGVNWFAGVDSGVEVSNSH